MSYYLIKQFFCNSSTGIVTYIKTIFLHNNMIKLIYEWKENICVSNLQVC